MEDAIGCFPEIVRRGYVIQERKKNCPAALVLGKRTFMTQTSTCRSMPEKHEVNKTRWFDQAGHGMEAHHSS
jgi:hypothetical protein